MKKIVSMLMVVAMLLACGAALAEKTTLVMGTNAQFPPYEYWDGDQIVGIDAEVAQAICDKLGYALEIQDMEFNSIISFVQAGKIDFGMAGMTVTEERLNSVDFTTSYATGIQAIIVPEGSDLTLDDLYADGAGQLIGVQTTTTGDIYATGDFGADRVLQYDNGATAVAALLAGKVDCVIIDNEPAKVFVEKNEGLKLLDTEYTVEDYAICVSKDRPELLAEINGALEELIADGTVKTILDKYIVAE